MIRRGFWLAAGAVLGVTGYRRVTRLARVLTVPRATATRATATRATATRSLLGTESAAGPRMLASPVRARSQVGRAVAAARFARDVREGMAEYRDLHRAEPDRSPRGHTPGNHTLRSRTLGSRTLGSRTLEARTLETRTLETQSYRTLAEEPAGPDQSTQSHREP